MKHSHWIIVLPLVLLGIAHANTIYNINAPGTTYFFSGIGGGDNATYSLIGPNINLSGGGTAFCSGGWCVGAQFAPGSTLVPDLNVDFESSSGVVSIAGQVYSGDQVVLYISSITAQGFTFPAGGNVPTTFTVVLPAKFSLVDGAVTVGSGQLFSVNVPQGKLVLTFNYLPAVNGQPASYSFSKGQYVVVAPEPATISLLAIGLVGVFGNRIRKRTG